MGFCEAKRLNRRGLLPRRAEPAVAVAVEKIERQPDSEPDPEPLPRMRGQTLHRVDARGCAQQPDGPDERDAEGTRTIGILVPEHDHPDADDGEGEERTDVG